MNTDFVHDAIMNDILYSVQKPLPITAALRFETVPLVGVSFYGHMKFVARSAMLATQRDMDRYLGDSKLGAYHVLYFSMKLKRKEKRWKRQ